MTRSITTSLSFMVLTGGILLLTACASSPRADSGPSPVLPTEQYPLQAQTMTRSISLRINPNGFSDNQRRALDQVAAKANWVNGEPVNVEIVTAGDPGAVSAGYAVSRYLADRDVSDSNVSVLSSQQQPSDIVTVNMVYYRAQVYECNRTWENITATENNKPYANFGCAVNANLAAQIDDPRDLAGPRAATPADATRKATVIGKYQKGEVTSSAADSAAKGTISSAIN